MTVATATKPATPRKRRARKVAVKTVKVTRPTVKAVKTVKRPSAAKLITPQRYWSDIQTRWSIHQYEINAAVKDFHKVVEYFTPYHTQLVKQVKQWSV